MKCLPILTVLILSTSVAHTKPLEADFGTGVLDWTTGIIRVVGVGTPDVLSPTGGLTDDELEASALRDAIERTRRALQRIYRQTPTPSPAASELERLASRLTVHRRLRASDGTVHLHATLPLRLLPQNECLEGGKLVAIKLDRVIKPTAALTLELDGATLQLSVISRQITYAKSALSAPTVEQLVNAKVRTSPATRLSIDGSYGELLRDPCTRLLVLLPGQGR